ncbi:MAG: tyrosine-type recombinase/integrase, partial [Streptosporangiaceae bacterium]
QAAYDLVLRLRARTGIAFDPHWFRHSAATRGLRDGVPIEVVSTLLGHSSVAVTSSVYGNSRELHQAGEGTAGQQVTGSPVQCSARPDADSVTWENLAAIPPGA